MIAEQETTILQAAISDSPPKTQEASTIAVETKVTESPVAQTESGIVETTEQTTTKSDDKAPIVVLSETTLTPEPTTISEKIVTSTLPVKTTDSQNGLQSSTEFIPTTTDVIDKAVSKVQAIVAAAGKELKGETTILPSEDNASETTIVPLSEVKNESIPVIIDRVIEKVDEIVKENGATTTSSNMQTETVTDV
uniref:Uncharacterized protein n=1 Tax=Panagrolaimus sp. ES5 TaxID=591445 RepID=A0AC34GKN3_9BILA